MYLYEYTNILYTQCVWMCTHVHCASEVVGEVNHLAL